MEFNRAQPKTKAKNKEKSVTGVFCFITITRIEMIYCISTSVLNSFDYCCGKKTRNFPFQPFLNNILSGCPRSSHSHMRKQKAKQEAAIWKLNAIIPCREYRTFRLTWKKCCWRVCPARKEKEKGRNNNKKPPLCFSIWVIFSDLKQELFLQLWPQNCRRLLASVLGFTPLHRCCSFSGWKNDPFTSPGLSRSG